MIGVILTIIAMAVTAGIGVFLFGCLLAMFALGSYKESENGTDSGNGIENPCVATGAQGEDAEK